MSKKMTRILVYNGNTNKAEEVQKWIERIDPDISLICETGSLAPVYRQMQGRFFVGSDSPPDCSIQTRRPGKYVSWHHQLTQRVGNLPDKPNLWRDRWAMQVLDKERREYNISTHANAVIQRDGAWLDNPGANEWRHHGLPRLSKRIRVGKRWGRTVRIGGDMNFPVWSRVKDSPHRFFRSHGLEVQGQGVMYFAWDPKKEDLVDFQILPKPPGADAHKALLIDLEDR